MPYEFLLLEVEDHIATITLNRPKVLNALNAAMLRELDMAFAELQLDTQVRVILLRGAGEKAFAAGADISEFAALDAASGEQMVARVNRIFRRIETLGKPVIACIQGYAVGGGCELALACTLRLAADSARLGQPEIKLGIIPGYGGSQRLPRLIGPSAALKMILTGDSIDSAEALHIGLVDEVLPAADLMPRATELAARIASMPPLVVAAALEAVTQGTDLPLDQALALETSIFGRLCGTEDQREGTRAFLEKRAPIWTGR
jgi:enoyl-CoA hydratase